MSNPPGYDARVLHALRAMRDAGSLAALDRVVDDLSNGSWRADDMPILSAVERDRRGFLTRLVAARSGPIGDMPPL